MSFADERVSLENRFYTKFVVPNPTVQVSWEGRNFNRPDPGVSWISFLLLGGYSGEQVTLGIDPVQRRYNLIQCNVHTPADKGAGYGAQLCDLIDKIFTSQTFACGLTGVIRCWTSAMKPMGVRDGKYLSILSIPYWYDTISDTGNTVGKMTKYTFLETPDNVITVFTLPITPDPDNFMLFMNGQLLNTPLSYTLSGNQVTFVIPPSDTDIIEVYA